MKNSGVIRFLPRVKSRARERIDRQLRWPYQSGQNIPVEFSDPPVTEAVPIQPSKTMSPIPTVSREAI